MTVWHRFLEHLKSRFGAVGVDPATGIDYVRLSRILSHRIRDKRLFLEALSHRSYLQVTSNTSAASNERMEFLGDAILNLVVAEYLFHQYATAREGDLTKIRARLVNKKALNVLAQNLQLVDFVLLSPSPSQIASRGMETILSDAYEAIVGAIYLDSGYSAARAFVERCLQFAIRNGGIRLEDDNFKSRLLEHAQALGFDVPRYVTINEEGPDHDRTFTVEVFIGNVSRGIGYGKNKKDAEQAAAEKALQQLAVQAK